MINRKKEIAEWQQALEDEFSESGVVGGGILMPVIEQEKIAGLNLVKKYRGHRVLLDSFFDFCGDTIKIAAEQQQLRGRQAQSEQASISMALLNYLQAFRTARAADVVASSGYPLEGYGILRNLKDQILDFAGVVCNLWTFTDQLSGVSARASDSKSMAQFRKKISTIEADVKSQLIGDKSGLSSDSVAELQFWGRLFNYQVHGSRFSMAVLADQLQSGRLTLGPSPEEMAETMYLNRSNELSWALVRLMPFLQPTSRSFGDKWAARWELMEKSHRFLVSALDRKITSAFIEFLDTKLRLDPSSSYIEAT